MRKLTTLFLLLLATTASAAFAGGHDPIKITPIPFSGHIQHQTYGGGTLATGVLVYSNTTNPTGYYTTGSSTNEFADDLHLVSVGVLTGFDFGYNKTTAGTTSCTVRFYADDPLDNPPTVVIAGPYTLNNLATGAQAYHVDVTDNMVLTADVWMSFKYTTTNTGPFIYDPPTIGTSHDYYYRFTPTPGYYFFGGAPPANFYAAVYATTATPVIPATWGRIKALY
jgi:hypothetical protein